MTKSRFSVPVVGSRFPSKFGSWPRHHSSLGPSFFTTCGASTKEVIILSFDDEEDQRLHFLAARGGGGGGGGGRRWRSSLSGCSRVAVWRRLSVASSNCGVQIKRRVKGELLSLPHSQYDHIDQTVSPSRRAWCDKVVKEEGARATPSLYWSSRRQPTTFAEEGRSGRPRGGCSVCKVRCRVGL
ncbi:hypothetical protein D1007_15293 [Hordeum vulgare]|nr:hypothetical protein D1007_15293 [Hordeum vulgare]